MSIYWCYLFYLPFYTNLLPFLQQFFQKVFKSIFTPFFSLHQIFLHHFLFQQIFCKKVDVKNSKFLVYGFWDRIVPAHFFYQNDQWIARFRSRLVSRLLLIQKTLTGKSNQIYFLPSLIYFLRPTTFFLCVLG